MVTAAMKLKDACSLEGKLTNLDRVLKSRDITLLTKVCIIKSMVFAELGHKEGFPFRTDASNCGAGEDS